MTKAQFDKLFEAARKHTVCNDHGEHLLALESHNDTISLCGLSPFEGDTRECDGTLSWNGEDIQLKLVLAEDLDVPYYFELPGQTYYGPEALALFEQVSPFPSSRSSV